MPQVCFPSLDLDPIAEIASSGPLPESGKKVVGLFTTVITEFDVLTSATY